MDWTNWLNGRDPFGSTGIDVQNTIAGNTRTDRNDPRLLAVGHWNSQANGSEGGEGTQGFVFDDPNFGSQGISHNGKPGYVQVGTLLTGGSGPGGSGLDSRIIDTGQVVYDPKWGAITPQSNIRDQTDTVERWMPAVVGAAFGGAVALHAAAAGASSGASASTGAFDTGGSSGVFDAQGNPLYTSPGESGALPGGAAPGGSGPPEGGYGPQGGPTNPGSTPVTTTPGSGPDYGPPEGGYPPSGSPGGPPADTGAPPGSGPGSGPAEGGTPPGGTPTTPTTPTPSPDDPSWYSRLGDWYRNLNPVSRFIINQGLSYGARAALASHQQQVALDANRQAENRRRQDQIRRSHVDPFSDTAFTRKGLIDNARTGG